VRNWELGYNWRIIGLMMESRRTGVEIVCRTKNNHRVNVPD